MSTLKEDIVIRYLEGRCTDEDFVVLHAWLKESEAHAAELFQLEELYRLRRFPLEDPERVALAEQRLLQRLKQEEFRKPRMFRLAVWSRYAAVWAVLAVLAVGLAYWFRSTPEEWLVATAAPGEVHELTLPDGTRVWLNESSVLHYPRTFEGKDRPVRLEGEAYFEVVHQADRPFRVETSALQVCVLGTSFQVRCWSDSLWAETTLMEGKVEVRNPGNQERRTLAPGQQAVVHSTTGRIQVQQVDPALEIWWRNEPIPFKQYTLPRIAALLEKCYQVQFVFSAEVDTLRTYSGVLKKKDDVEAVLKALQHAIPFDYQKKDNKIYLSNKTY